MRKLLILDKDGTIVSPKSGERYVQNPRDQALLSGVAEALLRYKRDGYAVAIATNQGGVAAGFKSLSDAIKETQYAMFLTGIDYAAIAHSYEKQQGEAYFLGRDYPKEGLLVESQELAFRKPAGGMLTHWARYFDVRNENVLFVGDFDSDERAAANADVKFMWADEWRWRKDSQNES